jgi:Uma2 family endonuclease
MSAVLKFETVSFEDYLAGERDVDVRCEYIDGYIYAMAGASETHNTIANVFSTVIENALKDECRAWQSDMKVIGHNKDKDFSYYPDIMGACGQNTGDQYVRTNPILIVEVLSPSTERTDLTEKRDNYCAIPSLIEYVVVAQDVPSVRIYRRRTGWQEEALYAEDRLVLESVELDIPVTQIYRRVQREVGLKID